MKKKTPSDGILVFDRYFGKKPSVALLLTMRVLFCALYSACAMIFVFSQYYFRTISLGYVGVVSALSAACLLLLFITFRRRYVMPVLALVVSALVYFNREVFVEKLTYFLDECMLLAEGRFIAPRGLLFHNAEELSVFNPDYCDGMALGTFLLCAAFSLLCAFSMKRRIRALPALSGIMLLCVPRFLSEDFEFNVLFVPVVLLTAAAISVSLNYTDGLAVVRSGASVYRAQVRQEESRFVSKTEKADIFKRISMQVCFYSKYATTGLYCACMIAVLVITSAVYFGQGEALDYTPIFEYIEQLGEDDSDVSVNEDKVSDYFTGADDKEQGLSISSPGRSNKSVIRVTFTGEQPIYLRGDIGVEFTGTGWITPVNDDSAWRSADFSESYRPAELRVLSVLLSELSDREVTVASESDVTIDYLTQTDVVFLPAYTGDYSFYDDPAFEVYGDYCVRVSEDVGSYINSVRCTALVNDLMLDGIADEEKVIKHSREVLDLYGLSVNDMYSYVVLDVEHRDDVIDDYAEYVNETYLNVPDDIGRQLSLFMTESGLNSALADLYYLEDTTLYRYKLAAAIDEYLKTNYTYSLSNSNRGNDAVIKFLTETKRGHCSLYASAMTLMLRQHGVPARYCTGFAVHPETIDGNSKVFKEKDMHAWVEVYLDEFGWVTFDPTSAAINALAAAGEEEPETPPQTTTRPPRSEETESPSVSTEESEDPELTDESAQSQPADENETSEIPQQDEPLPLKLIIAICAVVLAVIIISAVIWNYHNVRRRADAAVSAAARCSAGVIYNCIVDILDLHKLSPGLGELPVAFYERADKLFNAGLSSGAQLLEAAAFAQGDSSVDTDKLAELLKRLYGTAERLNGVFARYRLRKLVISRLREKI